MRTSARSRSAVIASRAGRDAPPLQHAGQAPLRDPAGADHRLQVPAAFRRLPDVREQQVGGLLDRHAAPHDADAGDAHALLEDLGGGSRQAAGHHAADILPVGHDAEVGDGDVPAEHRRVQRHVVEVRTAGVGIVVQEQVAGADVALVAGDHAACRPGAAPRDGWAARPRRRRPALPPATAPRRRSRAPRGSSATGRCGS